MAFQSVWYETELPTEVVKILEGVLEEKYDEELIKSVVEGGGGTVNEKIRKAKNAWLPSTHWISGFVMHFVNLANVQNFRYDLTGIDGQSVQYTIYDKGEFYNWHCDQGVASYYKPESNQKHGFEDVLLKDKLSVDAELVRKVSFSLQLSEDEDYKGGELQIMDESDGIYEVPKKKGLLVCFDSRARHRVNKVTSGRRKSLVGWVVGPRWR
jgi:Rps23 Pro-64 3,4-dihydroxylase Tpa1-like proline 4-hydroxylase